MAVHATKEEEECAIKMENGALTTSAPSGAKCLTNLSSKTLEGVKLFPPRYRRLWNRISQHGEV